ncbi:MAG: porin [Polyangiaceae bacterium]
MRRACTWLAALGLAVVAAPARAQDDADAGAPPAEAAPAASGAPRTPAEATGPADPAPPAANTLPPPATDPRAPAYAPAADNAPPADNRVLAALPLTIGAHITPSFDFKVRPEALPRDGTEYGFRTVAGVVLRASPLPMWSGVLHVLFEVQVKEVVTDVSGVDANGDGALEGTESTRETLIVPGARLEEAFITFQPLKQLAVRAGVMPIPFTLAQQTPITQRLFPNRPLPNDVFIAGSDIGALLLGDLAEGVLTASAGAFNGESLGLRLRGTDGRGIAMAARADVNPFGAFPVREGDEQRSAFRLGVGLGTVYRPQKLFDESSGYSTTVSHDVRLAASLRMAYAGIYLGLEYLRAQQTDTISDRPRLAEGAYVQASYFWLLRPTFAIAPVGRLGFTIEDEAVDDRTTASTELGLSFYPRADAPQPDILKLTLNYIGERRFEGEYAHGAEASMQLRF